jgi:hypothetical protein
MNTHNIDEGGTRGESFDEAMNKIALQAKAQQLLEARAQRRQALIGKLKKIGGFLVVIALFGAAYYYRNDIQAYVSAKLDTKPKMDATTAAALKGVQADADKRDQALDEISSSMRQQSTGAALKSLQTNAQNRDKVLDTITK